MQLSSRTRYSIMAVAELAKLEEKSTEILPISLATISERQKISLSYLEQLFAKLKKAEIVTSVKGPGGGYNLAKKPKNIKLNEIRNAIDLKENQEVPIVCPERGKCTKGFTCNSHSLWYKLSERINEFLGEITLDDLINDKI